MSTMVDSRMLATIEAINPVKRFILVNASLQSYVLPWDGLSIHVPGAEQVVPKVNNRTWHSYIDPKDHKPVPGTLVIWDLMESTALGERKTWDAVSAIRNCLGLRKEKGGFVYAAAWGAAGVSVITDGASREEIEAVRGSGKSRHSDYRLAEALAAVHAFDSRNTQLERSKMAPMQPTPEYLENMEIIATLNAKKRAALLDQFDIKPQRGTEREVVAPVTVEPRAKPAGRTKA